RAIVQSSSEIRQHAVEATAVARRDMVRLAEIALPLRRLLREDMAAVGVARLVLAGSSLPEALGRAPMRLDLGHCDVLVGSSSTGPGGGWRHAFRPALACLMAPGAEGSRGGSNRPTRNAGEPSRALCTEAGPCGKSPSPRTRGGEGHAPTARDITSS